MRVSFLKPLASLKLTVYCLLFAFVLVLAGTFAQKYISNFEAQQRYFNTWIVFWTPADSHAKIPVFPGGWLIGAVLLTNLTAALVARFQFSTKKFGLLLAHLGIIVLLVGQFASELWKTESQMRIETGQTLNYSEDYTQNELVFIDTSPADHDDVVAIPEDILLKSTGAIQNARLPFAIKVLNYLPNSTPTMLNAPKTSKTLVSTNGVGNMLCFSQPPNATSPDQDRNPALLIEIVTPQSTLGSWVLSTWLTKPRLATEVRNWLGDTQGLIEEPQHFTYSNRLYQVAFRPKRYYKPYSLKLEEFHHDMYVGSSIPSNFSSKVHITDPARGENRDVLISMNNPFRYHGETYYQSSFESGDTVSILQVVQNPASLTPYISSAMVSIGLLFHFLMHLTEFAKKRAKNRL
jgi:hypothetical protein